MKVLDSKTMWLDSMIEKAKADLRYTADNLDKMLELFKDSSENPKGPFIENARFSYAVALGKMEALDKLKRYYNTLDGK